MGRPIADPVKRRLRGRISRGKVTGLPLFSNRFIPIIFFKIKGILYNNPF